MSSLIEMLLPCVFDRDKNPKNSNDSKNFNDAFKLAEKHELKVAYSNDAFELWYLLHFHYYDTAISRKEYQRMLTQKFGCKYEKNSQTIYQQLKEQQEDAMKNAKKLLNQYKPLNPERDNPSTTVHLLVEALNCFIL